MNEESRACVIMQSGALCYWGAVPTNSATLHVTTDEDGPQQIPACRVDRGDYFCEASLWMPWWHTGTMRVIAVANVVSVRQDQFRTTMTRHPRSMSLAISRAKQFVETLEETVEKYGLAWDLDMFSKSYLCFRGEPEYQDVLHSEMFEVQEQARRAMQERAVEASL